MEIGGQIGGQIGGARVARCGATINDGASIRDRDSRLPAASDSRLEVLLTTRAILYMVH